MKRFYNGQTIASHVEWLNALDGGIAKFMQDEEYQRSIGLKPDPPVEVIFSRWAKSTRYGFTCEFDDDEIPTEDLEYLKSFNTPEQRATALDIYLYDAHEGELLDFKWDIANDIRKYMAQQPEYKDWIANATKEAGGNAGMLQYFSEYLSDPVNVNLHPDFGRFYEKYGEELGINARHTELPVNGDVVYKSPQEIAAEKSESTAIKDGQSGNDK